MFSSLDDQMKRDDTAGSSSRERWFKYASVVIVSIFVFGGLYAGIMLLE